MLTHRDSVGNDLDIIKTIASPIAFHQGETVFEEGEPAEAVYVVQKGTVDSGHPLDIHKWVDFGPYGLVEISNNDQYPASSMNWQGVVSLVPGAVLGDRGVFNHSCHSSSAFCRTDCDLLRLDTHQLTRLKVVSPRLFSKLLEAMKKK